MNIVDASVHPSPSRSEWRWRPQLLLLALFLGTAPFLVPNARILRDASGWENLIAWFLLPCTCAALAVSAIAVFFSVRRRGNIGSVRVLAAATVGYPLVIAALWALVLLDTEAPRILGFFGSPLRSVRCAHPHGLDWAVPR